MELQRGERHREDQLQRQEDQLVPGRRDHPLPDYQDGGPAVLRLPRRRLPEKDRLRLAPEEEVQREVLGSRRKVRWSDDYTWW